jgi:hypothetical protein
MYNSIASLILFNACSSVSACDLHPGRSGTHTEKPLSFFMLGAIRGDVIKLKIELANKSVNQEKMIYEYDYFISIYG